MSDKHIAVVGSDPARICQWLRDEREAAGKARRAASVLLDVTEKTVARWEDPNEGSLPDAAQFFALVRLYHAEKRVLVLLGSWEKFSKGAASAAGRPTKAAGG